MLFKDTTNEVRFPRRVRLAGGGVFRGECLLQLRVPARERRIGAYRIAERRLLGQARAAGRQQVQVRGPVLCPSTTWTRKRRQGRASRSAGTRCQSTWDRARATASAQPRSPTAACTSMIGLAARPGTEVEPTCWVGTASQRASTESRSRRSRAPRRCHPSSGDCTRTSSVAHVGQPFTRTSSLIH